MLKDEEGKGSCGNSAWRVKRKYVTRRSINTSQVTSSKSGDKVKIVNELINGIVTDAYKDVATNEGKTGKQIDVLTVPNTRIPSQNDKQNGVLTVPNNRILPKNDKQNGVLTVPNTRILPKNDKQNGVIAVPNTRILPKNDKQNGVLTVLNNRILPKNDKQNGVLTAPNTRIPSKNDKQNGVIAVSNTRIPSKNDKQHGVIAVSNTRIPAKNDKPNGIPPHNDPKHTMIHTVTNVKAPVFKYSKCRTCRIPCNGDFLKKSDFKVNVEKLSISKCLKYHGNIKRLAENDVRKGVDGNIVTVKEEMYNGDHDSVLNGTDESSDMIGEFVVNGDNQLNFVVVALNDGDKDLKNNVPSCHNEDIKENNGDHLGNVVQKLCDSRIDFQKVDPVLISSNHNSNGLHDFIDGDSKINDGDNSLITKKASHNINKDVSFTNGDPKINDGDNSLITKKGSHNINKGDTDLHNGDNGIITNGICELNKGALDLKDGDEGLSNAAVNLKNGSSDKLKVSDSIINDENIFSMVLRSRKCLANNEKKVYNNIHGSISDTSSSESVDVHVNTKHVSSSHDSITSVDGKGAGFNGYYYQSNSSKNSNEGYKCQTEISDNDILRNEETVIISKDTYSVLSSGRKQNLVDECTKECELNGEKVGSEALLPSTVIDENDNVMETICVNQHYEEEQVNDSDTKSSTLQLNDFTDKDVFHNTTDINSSNKSNKKFGILEYIDPNLAEKYKGKGIKITNLDIYQNEKCIDKNQSCKCDIIISDCSKDIVDLNRNINSEQCRVHNFIHNRKHVRLKGLKKKHIGIPSYIDLIDKDTISCYIFESTRRLKFLHNQFYTSIVKPDDDILQSMVEDIELGIDIFDEDRTISNEKSDSDTVNDIVVSNITDKEPSCPVSYCEWDECDRQFSDSSKLLDHLKATHIDDASNETVFSCLWRKCKFSNQPSSHKWLSNHILRHCSLRPFKCVILGCELSFATQSGLARHVPSHFNEGKVRRTCVTTGVGSKGNENGRRSKLDTNSNSMDNSEDNDELNEPVRKKTKYEKFVDRYKASHSVDKRVQNVINRVKYKLQISTCNSSLNCGYVGRYFRFNHKVIGKRTSKDGSTDMLLSPSSTKIFPYKSFWFDGNTFDKQKSLYVDISVSDLSDDMKQLIYDNGQISRMKRDT